MDLYLGKCLTPCNCSEPEPGGGGGRCQSRAIAETSPRGPTGPLCSGFAWVMRLEWGWSGPPCHPPEGLCVHWTGLSGGRNCRVGPQALAVV